MQTSSQTLRSDGPVKATYEFTNKKGNHITVEMTLTDFEFNLEIEEEPIYTGLAKYFAWTNVTKAYVEKTQVLTDEAGRYGTVKWKTSVQS